MTLLLVAVGGALGSALRYAAASALDARWPHGTLAVNVAGSALLGLLVGLDTGLGVGGTTYALLGVGFCGGLTTWSAFAGQTHRLGPRAGTSYAVATLGLALAACALGFWLGAQA